MENDRDTSEVLAEAGQLYEQYIQLTALAELPRESDAPEFASPLPAPLGLAFGTN